MMVDTSQSSTTRRTLTYSAQVLGRLHLDGPLLIGLGAIAVVGLLVLYSASGQSLAFTRGQGIRLALGLVAMISLAQVAPKYLRMVAPWLYGLGLVLLLIVEIVGDFGKGAQRWLDLGVVRFQPSEIMKLALPMLCAWFLHERPLPPKPGTLAAIMGFILVPAALVAHQPDLGTALLITASGLFLVYLAGLSWKIIVPIVVVFIAGIWFVSDLGRCTSVFHEYQCMRVQTLIDPTTDPRGAGYHTIQGTIAIGSGGVYGKGWMNGSQAQLEFLPERSTDFIFAVIGEEFGLLGLLFLLALYLFVIGRGIFMALECQDTFARLLAGTLSLTFFFYVFVNAGMVSGILPVVGVPLPLVSYGGTSMVTLMASFGILMSLHSHRKLMGS
jgi:rod shape determining protein RodA